MLGDLCLDLLSVFKRKSDSDWAGRPAGERGFNHASKNHPPSFAVSSLGRGKKDV